MESIIMVFISFIAVYALFLIAVAFNDDFFRENGRRISLKKTK